MVSIPSFGDPTLQAIYLEMERRQEVRQRDYLGASLIGNPCARQIWYDYNGYPKDRFDAKTLMNFEDGHRTEELTASRLRLVPGLVLITHGSDNKQMGFSVMNGKFKGHYDGKIKGIIQAPKSWHIWECKASGHKKFGEFQTAKAKYGEKRALKNWNEGYYAQAQLYMHFEKIDRHYLTVALAGGRDYDSCRTEYDEAAALFYIDRAEKIIEAQSPPPRINEKPDFYLCRFCSFKDVCRS